VLLDDGTGVSKVGCWFSPPIKLAATI
jgi:hypothetical protein